MVIDINNFKKVIDTKSEFGESVYGDTIYFPVGDNILEYRASEGFLSNPHGRNDEIFILLGLDKVRFCRKAYGYSPRSGTFPEARYGDNKALLSVIFNLFSECEKNYIEVKKVTLNDVNCAFINSLENDYNTEDINFDEIF